jgi:hypothetical protein
MGAGRYEDPDCPEARAGLDEADPQEEVGVESCDSVASRCETRGGDLEGRADESEFTIMDELHEQMRVEPIRVIEDPTDGLPLPVTGPTQFAPPFTHETMVCIEDTRQYVEIFAQEMALLGWFLYEVEGADAEPSLTSQGADLSRIASRSVFKARSLSRSSRIVLVSVGSMFGLMGHPQERRRFDPKDVFERWGGYWVESDKQPVDDPRRVWIPVRPIRERCRYYKRMCLANDDQPDPEAFLHYIRFRNCMMRRSVGGAFLSLRDEAVYACDYRDPPDEASVRKHLDEPDERKLVDKPHLTRLPLFGLDGDVLKEPEDTER